VEEGLQESGKYFTTYIGSVTTSLVSNSVVGTITSLIYDRDTAREIDLIWHNLMQKSERKQRNDMGQGFGQAVNIPYRDTLHTKSM
jgi:hypothetical protein